jgi:hypothetical protein
MSVIYIHESISNKTTPSDNLISMLDNKAAFNDPTNYIDISFCDLQSANSYLNDQISQFSNTFSSNNKATITVIPNTNTIKTMQQRYLDLFTMQLAFNGILSDLSKSIYGDDYLNLQRMQQQNIELRNSLDTELDELYGNDPNEIFKKAQLDSTIYSSILWVILAILLIYYIFVRVDE